MPSLAPRKITLLAGVLAALIFTGRTASAADLSWDSNGDSAGFGNATGTWGTSAFWNDNPTGGPPTSAFTAATTSSDTANFGTATVNYANGTIGVAAGGVSVGNIVIGGGQTQAINLGTSGNAITIQDGITKNAGSAVFNITSPVSLGGTQTWTNHSSSALTMSGLISGAGDIVKNGTGRFSFGASSNANTYTGTTTINGGVLAIANHSASLGAGNLTLNGGVLTFYWSSGLTRTLGTGTNQVTIPGGESGFGGDAGSGPTINLGSTVVWGAAGEGSATGHFNPSKLVLGSPDTNNAGATTFSSGINLNGATRTIVVPFGTNVAGNNATISGVISSTGTAGLIKEGAGRLNLNVANTYNGGTTLQAGTLQLGNATALGSSSGPLTVNDGLLNLNGQTNVTVGNLTGTGGMIANNASNGRTFIIGSGNGTGGDFQGVIADKTTGTGTIALTKTGTGTITLSGTNTHSGTTLISGGTLQIGSGGTTGSLASAVTNNATLIYNRSDDFSVGYSVNGSGVLIKQGAGTLTFTVPAAYSGDTTISAGTLRLNHPNASNDDASVSIAATGATLNLNFSGTDSVKNLYIGATRMPNGVYKAIGNPAAGTELAQITGSGTLNVIGDLMPPTLQGIVDNQNGLPVAANSPVTYTITFSEDIDIATVSAADFANAGTAPISIGAITETTPGVLTVIVTPTGAGSVRLKIPAGASLTDLAANPLNTTADLLDNTTIGVYISDFGTPALVGISPVATNVGSTITLAMPPGAKPGDVLVASIANYAAPSNFGGVSNSGTGWIALRTGRLSGQNNTRLGVYYRVVTAADPSSFSLDLLYDAPFAAAGVVMAFSNVDMAYGPLDVTAGSIYTETNATATVGPAPAISTVRPNTLLLMLGMAIGDSPVSWSNWATSSLGSLTELYDVNSSGAYKAISLGAAWVEKAATGTTGTGSATLSGSIQNASMLMALRPSYNSVLIAALNALKAHITGQTPLNATQIAAHKLTIFNNRLSFRSSTTAIATAFDLVRTYDQVLGPLWVARSLPARASLIDDIHYTMFTVMQYLVDYSYSATNLANNPDLFNGFLFGSSANFPGSCTPPADPEQVHTAVINANYLNTWGRTVFGETSTNPSPKPTGTYLAPGTVATVTVPASLVGRNYKIRVGAHISDFEDKTSVRRLNRCTVSYTINSTTTQVSNPLGGGIYIDVPQYISNVGIVSIQIKNAVRSPYFSAKSFHQTTLAEWQNIERNHPAPWADFQSEKVMMQVPTSWIYALNDPVTLMADWDRSADIVNDFMGFPRDRGRETIFNVVDLLLKDIAFTPGYPAVNNTYVPGTNYNNGYANNYLVRGPQFSPWQEFHELGHAYGFAKFPGETESDVNLLFVPVLNLGFGYSIDEAFRKSIDGPAYVTLDTTAIAWMMCDNFLNGIAMAQAEKQYAYKGHAKFVEIARLFGWGRLNHYFYSMNVDAEANQSIPEDVDSMLLRLCTNAGIDIRPLFHFWGVPPINSTGVANSIQTANLPNSRAIYDTLVRYKSLVPTDNATFRTFANGWWGRQPLSTGFSEERNHATRWDNYDAAMATATAARAQTIIDLYFPAGRPSDYGDWRSQCATADLVDPQADLDGDGMSNDHERIWGMDPTAPALKNPIQFNSGLKSGNFSYTRRNPALTGLDYTVWTSTNLTDWTEDSGAQQTYGTPDANGVQTVEVALSPELPGNPTLFIRMQASE